jgi:type I restriction enzyme M protein
VTLDELRVNDYALTPGRYVGTADVDGVDEPFEERFSRLRNELSLQLQESRRLSAVVEHLIDEAALGL